MQRAPAVLFAVALAVALVLGAALNVGQATALSKFEHADAQDCEDCHARGGGKEVTNASCTACHTGYRVAPGDLCWDCHQPGLDTSVWRTSTACSTRCHLFETRGNAYKVPFAHGTRPHEGADYAPCLSCHRLTRSATDPDGSEHHDALDGAAPTCRSCHDQPLHDGLADCAACHTGMDRPPVPATCTACHPAASFGSATCTDPACHGGAVIHDPTPGLGKACADCHTPHYEGLGSCVTCHPEVPAYHHLGARATPLADCGACHDGTVAGARGTHVAWVSCATCHTGMDLPQTPAVCSTCHSVRDFGSRPCSACHSGGILGDDQIHREPTDEATTCTDCHRAHFVDLGACDACHARAPGWHHGTVALDRSSLAFAPLEPQVTFGQRVVVSGRLTSGETGLPGGRVVVQWREAGTATFETVTSAFTIADGSFVASFRARASGDLRAVFRGLAGEKASAGPAVAGSAIAVRPDLSLAILKSSGRLATALTVKKGAKVAFHGAVAPRRAGAAGVTLVLERARSTTAGTEWVVARQVTRTLDDQGRCGWTWKAGKVGRYRLRAIVAPSTAFLGGESPLVTVRVR